MLGFRQLAFVFGITGRVAVKKLVVTSLVVLVVSLTGFSQTKGEDKGGQRVRDSGSAAPATNGSKVDTGSAGVSIGEKENLLRWRHLIIPTA